MTQLALQGWSRVRGLCASLLESNCFRDLRNVVMHASLRWQKVPGAGVLDYNSCLRCLYWWLLYVLLYLWGSNGSNLIHISLLWSFRLQVLRRSRVIKSSNFLPPTWSVKLFQLLVPHWSPIGLNLLYLQPVRSPPGSKPTERRVVGHPWQRNGSHLWSRIKKPFVQQPLRSDPSNHPTQRSEPEHGAP